MVSNIKTKRDNEMTTTDDLKKLRTALSLLNSMIYGGEEYSETSKRIVNDAYNVINSFNDLIEAKQLCKECGKDHLTYQPFWEEMNTLLHKSQNSRGLFLAEVESIIGRTFNAGVDFAVEVLKLERKGEE